MEQAVIDIEELSPGVWGVELEDHSRVIAKHQALGSSTVGHPDDLLVVEAKVLNLLVERGCVVPRCLGPDAETRFIFFEHCGDHTLDDLAQEVGVPQELRANLISEFCRIEQALSELGEHLLPHVSTTDTGGPTEWRAHANDGLASILSYCGIADSVERELTSGLEQICNLIDKRERTLGSTDFNAQNVVVSWTVEKVSFIEFAKIGWDWPERRLVQYVTSLGGSRQDGQVVDALNPELVGQYAAHSAGGDVALDGHHILFHLQAAAMLIGCLQQPELPYHRALLHSWRRPQRRLHQHATALTSPLSESPTAQFRALFSEAVHPFIEREQ